MTDDLTPTSLPEAVARIETALGMLHQPEWKKKETAA